MQAGVKAGVSSQKKPCMAVLASGSGTTTEALIKAGLQNRIKATVGLVISSRQQAGIVPRIARLNKTYGLAIDCVVINSQTHPPAKGELVEAGGQTAAEEKAILKILLGGNFDLIALLGYLKKVGPRLVNAFGWQPDYTSVYQVKMVNTHSGLLPETKGFYGVHIQEHVLSEHLAYGGQTLHAVAEKYDEGPVIASHRVKVKPSDTPEELFKRVRMIEKRYLPIDIDRFIKAGLQFKENNARNLRHTIQ